MRVARIVPETYVDGPGRRTALFVQGCSLHCQGCQNQHLWQPDGGEDIPASDLATRLLATALPVTISGGEPFDQAGELARLLRSLRGAVPDLHIVLYSGYAFEQLRERAETTPPVSETLRLADVLVDGPYVAELDEPGLQYLGSSNQRAIVLPETLDSSKVITTDWQSPEIVITEDGDLLGAAAVVAQFAALGLLADSRRCGEIELEEGRN